MENTPLQELIEFLDAEISKHTHFVPVQFITARDKAIELLCKEASTYSTKDGKKGKLKDLFEAEEK